MALTVTGTNAQSSMTNNTSISHSPTVARGDLFIIHMHLGDSGKTISTPAGWSAIYNTGGPEAGGQSAVFYKTMSALDSTPITFSWTGGTSYASVMARITSNDRGAFVWLAQSSTGETATDNQASYTTPSITVVQPNQVLWGVGVESANSTSSFTSSDTEVGDSSSGQTSSENVAIYTLANAAAGSVSKTMTPNAANKFHAAYWIAEVRETPRVQPLVSNEFSDGRHVSSAAHIRANRW